MGSLSFSLLPGTLKNDADDGESIRFLDNVEAAPRIEFQGIGTRADQVDYIQKGDQVNGAHGSPVIHPDIKRAVVLKLQGISAREFFREPERLPWAEYVFVNDEVVRRSAARVFPPRADLPALVNLPRPA